MSDSKAIAELLVSMTCERMRNEALDIVAGHDDLYEQIVALPDVTLDELDLPESLYNPAVGPSKVDLYLDLAFMLLIGMAIGLTWLLVF